jgi:hypothetical protein
MGAALVMERIAEWKERASAEEGRQSQRAMGGR